MKTIVFVAISLLAISCGKDELSLPSTNLDVFELADNSFTSVAQSLNTSARSVTCDGSGEPTATSAGNINYAGEKIFCQFSDNSKSPDTIKGSYFIASKVLCAIEKNYSFLYLSSLTTADNISFPENDSCFGVGGFDSNGDSDINDTIVLSLRESALNAQDYDYLIEIQLGQISYNGAGSNDVELYLKDSDGILAAKIYQDNRSVTEIVFNLTSTEILFENRDFDNTRHQRVKIDGSFDFTTGSFSSIGLAQAILSEGTTSVLFGYDGSAEWVDHYIGTSRQVGYDICSSGGCASLTTTFNSSFYTFPANTSAYDNANILSIPSFDMSF